MQESPPMPKESVAPERRLALFPESTQVVKEPGGWRLSIGGCDLAGLAGHYGTPLYLYDAATLETAVATYLAALVATYPGETSLTYAGKAFLCLAIAQWSQRHGLWLDCSSLGELAVAAAARVPRPHILLHGVNKSPQLLEAAVRRAGTIVVDNLAELERLVSILGQSDGPAPDLWLRFRPGQAVDTHSHVQTGQEDSKFGLSWEEALAAAAICRTHNLPLSGLHFHLGSQFRDPAPLRPALSRTLELAQAIQVEEGWTLCPGGGLGVAYHEETLPQPNIEAYVRLVAEQVVAGCEQRNLPLPCLRLEPGRSLVARAGVALYQIGEVKQTGSRRWLLLDGGMADNPRFALYQARYSALPVKEPFRPPTGPATLAGTFCEGGDVLIEDLPMPDVGPGELIAVPVSGAYQLSMASNYNGATRPAVLWLEASRLEGGQAGLIQARETTADLLHRDRPLPGKSPSRDSIPFYKYQGNGNDYLVVDLADWGQEPTASEIQRLCDRHFGFGADGLLVDHSAVGQEAAVRIYNPDGSEAEKSGNGLLIFSRYLWDTGRVALSPFPIETRGGRVRSQVQAGGQRVTIMMGQVTFEGQPTLSPHKAPGDVTGETMTLDGEEITYTAVSLGNPHCVILRHRLSAAEAVRLGPLIENEPRFPRRTNVQFMRVLDRANIQIEIWERGAGYTLASGSSSCAAAAVAHRLGLCDRAITVHMPGGEIEVIIGRDGSATMTGSVSRVWSGSISEEVFGEEELE